MSINASPFVFFFVLLFYFFFYLSPSLHLLLQLLLEFLSLFDSLCLHSLCISLHSPSYQLLYHFCIRIHIFLYINVFITLTSFTVCWLFNLPFTTLSSIPSSFSIPTPTIKTLFFTSIFVFSIVTISTLLTFLSALITY